MIDLIKLSDDELISELLRLARIGMSDDEMKEIGDYASELRRRLNQVREG